MPPTIELPPKATTNLLPLPLDPNWQPTIPLQDAPKSSAVDFILRATPKNPTEGRESALLKAVKNALRGTDTDDPTVVQSTWFHDADNPDGREISWNAKHVALSCGGVMIKRWSFAHAKEDVQYACLGLLEQNAQEAQKYFTPAPADASVAEDEATVPSLDSDKEERPTFGPFAQANTKRRPFSDNKKTISAVFVFLRSIGKIYLQNGIDFTINIPFVVRRAWPVSPHGVLVQRVLEPSELEEAAMTGEPVLPTMFTITSPFQEPAAVGLADRIEGGPGGDGAPLVIHTEEQNAGNVLKSISPTEMVLWVSCMPENKYIQPERERNKPLAVTVDPRRNTLSIWVYAHAGDAIQTTPSSAPSPSTAAVLSQVKSRHPGVVSHGRRTSAAFEGDRLDSKHTLSFGPSSGLPATQEVPINQDGFPVTGLPPTLSSVATFPSLASVPGTVPKPKRDDSPAPPDERMKANYWMECVLEIMIPEASSQWWKIIKVAVFDERFDGKIYRSKLAIGFRDTNTMYIFDVGYDDESKRFKAIYARQYPAIAMASVMATRPGITDLLAATSEGRVYLISGISLYDVNLVDPLVSPHTPYTGHHLSTQGMILDFDDVRGSFLSVVYQNGAIVRANISLCPTDELTLDCLRVLSRAISASLYKSLFTHFLVGWTIVGRISTPSVQFQCFQTALIHVLKLRMLDDSKEKGSPWDQLGASEAHARLKGDVALKMLRLPPTNERPVSVAMSGDSVNYFQGPALYALHSLGEALRLQRERHASLQRLASLICALALSVRPEWADYWKRLIPDAMEQWPDSSRYDVRKVDDRLPTWPQDACAYIHATLVNSKDDRKEFQDISYVTNLYEIEAPFTFGTQDPLKIIQDTVYLYFLLAEPRQASTPKRAEAGVKWLLQDGPGMQLLDKLPLGVAAPIREAVRTCQLTPPADWPLYMYTEIGRNDLAASASENLDGTVMEGYRPAKDFMNPTKAKLSIGKILAETKAAAAGEVDATSGVEMDDNHVGRVRFKDDRRLEEIGRMLNSSIISTIKAPEKPEQSEHDQTMEHQKHIHRVAERTLALPYGRAMYTFASVMNVTRESHAIPKIEYGIKILPMNITITPEAGKIIPEASQWGEFHNGVAAGLRIAPTAKGVESSWIAFNKPSELTPEHAGFLFALGLTGHLRELMTWHTFQYLTPKHDLTSIAVLLGLAASHLGKGTQKVVKLLAVHTPALLPTPNVDLNVSLLTQAAGLSALGLLYLGTKNRRMAEVCLGEISRRDLVQPDLSNEHREAYTFSAAISFGMIMLGKGSLIPADLDLVQRLTILLHGDVTRRVRDKPLNPFDINLTSPAASIALGLMYLKTGRQDIADILTIPDTAVSLNRIPPNFLLVRMIARGMIMWDDVQPSKQWVFSQIPGPMLEKMAPLHAGQARALDDAYELAYHNVIAGCCFVLGLKYAGTASHDAYNVILHFYDAVTKLVFPRTGAIYDQMIKRAALRDGLNQISLALSMVMAGTADISVMRRIRNAYGVFQNDMYHTNFHYGVHVATMQSLGLLGLGGGRSTLGTSDAAIACMVTAFFPRAHVTPFDNKSYLQALRHLWVLAVEPRCLVARDVDTGEVVYLPVKIQVKFGDRVGTSQLLSPTLIPAIDQLVSIRVDTPRYWPFYLDTAQPRNRQALIRNQTLFVKRRTAFLSYIEDPRGSRSLFVRSGAGGPGDGQILDFARMTDEPLDRDRDISEFITSFSNNVSFLAFADALCRSEEEDASEKERALHGYAHAALLDCILQDKPQTLQAHMALYYARHADPQAKGYNLLYHDMRFANDFYSRVYEKSYSGKAENNPRPGLLRDSQFTGALLSMETPLDEIRETTQFKKVLGRYIRNEPVRLTPEEMAAQEEGEEVRDAEVERKLEQMLSWYLLKNSVPNPEVLMLLSEMMQMWKQKCLESMGANVDARKAKLMDIGLREAAHLAGSRLMNSFMSSGGWSARSVEEVFEAWDLTR